MNIQTTINRIQAYITDPPNYNKIVESINIAISRINAMILPFDTYITIAFDSAGLPSADVHIPSADTRIPSEMGVLRNNSWDDSDNKLTITDERVIKLKTVYKDGLALKKVSKEGIALSIYTGNEVAIVGREIYFTSDISDGDNVFSIKCILKFESITSATEDYNIPAYFEDLIYNIVLFMLTKDKEQNAEAKLFLTAELEAAGINTKDWSTK